MYRGQLDEILNYIGKLQQLDVTNVEPMTQMSFATGETNPPGPGSSQTRNAATRRPRRALHRRRAVLAQAPDAVKPFFRVPKVIER